MAQESPAAIVAWAERQGEPKRGAAAHLTDQQKQEIRIAYLTASGRITNIDLARRFGVNRETVARCLSGPEFEQLRGELEAEIKASAVQTLKSAVLPAAEAWTRAIDEAAEKGDHKPAKELLLHTGAIDPLNDGKADGVLVLCGGRRFRDVPEAELRRYKTVLQIGVDDEDVSIDLGVAMPSIHKPPVEI